MTVVRGVTAAANVGGWQPDLCRTEHCQASRMREITVLWHSLGQDKGKTHSASTNKQQAPHVPGIILRQLSATLLVLLILQQQQQKLFLLLHSRQ